MSDDAGSELARQVRRLLDKKPDHAVLKGVESHIIQAIKEFGDPDENVAFPPHLYVKKNFDNASKRLEEEFKLLDINGKEKDKAMNGGMAQPRALTPWITVAHSRLPGWASLALPRPSES